MKKAKKKMCFNALQQLFHREKQKACGSQFFFQIFLYCKLLIITNPLRADRAFFLDFGFFVYCCVVCVLLGCRVQGLGLNFLIKNIEKYRNISKKSEIF